MCQRPTEQRCRGEAPANKAKIVIERFFPSGKLLPSAHSFFSVLESPPAPMC